MPKSYAVLDSGILLATVQTETYTPHAKALVNSFQTQNIQLAAPTLIYYEFVAVTRKWVYRQLTTSEKAESALYSLLRLPIEPHFDEALLRRAYVLATAFNRPTANDSQYLALAERLSCDFWTADERLYNALKDQFPGIHWLGNWQP